MDNFASSDEAAAAEALFDAYRSGGVEEVRSCIKGRNIFLELDNQVHRRCKRMFKFTQKKPSCSCSPEC